METFGMIENPRRKIERFIEQGDLETLLRKAADFMDISAVI